jgi:hypothetical protein
MLGALRLRRRARAELRISLLFLAINTWDREHGLVYVDGVLAWDGAFDQRNSVVLPAGCARHKVQLEPVEIVLDHAAERVTITVPARGFALFSRFFLPSSHAASSIVVHRSPPLNDPWSLGSPHLPRKLQGTKQIWPGLGDDLARRGRRERELWCRGHPGCAGARRRLCPHDATNPL